MNMTGMALALQEAEKALKEGEVPIGAVLMRGDKILWMDHNRREQLKDPTAHAEMLCLRKGAEIKGDWRLSDCTLYVTLEPCPMCAGAMIMSRLGQVVYGIADPEKGCCGSLYDFPADPAFHTETRWTSGEQAEGCRRLLDLFFQTVREKHDPIDAEKL